MRPGISVEDFLVADNLKAEIKLVLFFSPSVHVL
jgi:hypothetical protein